MERRLPEILVVGSRTSFSAVFERLEEERRYRFTYAPDPQSAPSLSRSKPSAVVLHLPETKADAQQALACLETLTDQAPVVVMSRAADMSLYLAAMTKGAFDYFTSYTPLDEVIGALDKAIRWRKRQVA